MTMISPLLQNRLDNANKAKNLNNRHEKIYEDLQKKAHEAKPNEPKAYIIKQGLLGDPVAATKDMINDGKNFFKVLHTGHISDNNLGRINDLGLKIGSALIATYLAIHSKTKTEKVMRFFGGGMFIAMMALWPKLFINIPARLIHGFRIDDKYMNAYGDKKDFFLDNQYLSWDAFPEEEMRKNAKRAGIDYDSENGKEKIQRKMQKTALQNRTLWMATAGFATPLLTSMTCNFAEPKIKDAIRLHNFNKSKSAITNGLDGLKDIQADKKVDTKALRNLFAEYREKQINDDFYGKLKEIFAPTGNKHLLGVNFPDEGDTEIFKGYDVALEFGKTWKKVRNSISKVTSGENDIRELLKGKLSNTEIFADALMGEPVEVIRGPKPINIDGIIASLKKEGKFAPTIEELEKALIEGSVGESDRKAILASVKTDDSTFFDIVENYYKNVHNTFAKRLKKVVNLANAIVGKKDESVSAAVWNEQAEKLTKILKFSTKDLEEIKYCKNDGDATKVLIEKLQKHIKDLAKEDEKGFKKALKTLGINKKFKSSRKLIEQFNEESLQKIITQNIDMKQFEKLGVSEELCQELNKNLLGNSIRNICTTCDERIRDIESSIFHPIGAAIFERNRLNGVFEGIADEEIKSVMERMIYDGNFSTLHNRAFDLNIPKAMRAACLCFGQPDENKIIPKEIEETIAASMDLGEEAAKGFKALQKKLFNIVKQDNGDTPTQKYLDAGSLVRTIRAKGTEIHNNKSWLKMFGPMTIALIAITLLVQPFFGNIKDEFPEEKKGGTR